MTKASSLRTVSIIFALLALALLVSCGGSDGPSISTTKWEPDGNGFLKFSTNDSQYLRYGFVHTDSNTTSPTYFPTSTVTATLKKMSGAESYGYGVVFGYQNFDNTYGVLITCTGGCKIFKTVSGTDYDILDWGPSGAIYTGYGAANEIEVTYSYPSYSVSINNTHIYSFTPDATLSTNGRSGLYASVGSSSVEHFPDTPVDIRGKMTVPIAMP